MELILILIAGGMIGVWHERDKQRACKDAYKAGASHARQAARAHRVYAEVPREVVPVPVYSERPEFYAPAYSRRASAQAMVNEIAQAAVTLGGAAGRVQ